MWLDEDKVKQACSKAKLSLNGALRGAKVSKCAYYSCLSNTTLLPQSISDLAETLKVSPIDLLSWGPAEILKARLRERKLRRIIKRHPRASTENVWHTLLLLETSPIERLRGSLRRGH